MRALTSSSWWLLVVGLAACGGSGFEREPLSGRVPDLYVEHADGARDVLGFARPTVLHFWASWCEPCRAELPALLALEARGVDVVAVAVDDQWPAMKKLLGADGAGARAGVEVVRLLERAGSDTLGVAELPMSFFVAPGGVLRERYIGVRDWAGAAAREHLAELAGVPPDP